MSINGDVVGRDKITINIGAHNHQQSSEEGYLIGKQLKFTRADIGLEPSQFIELIGFKSEKVYLQMERDETGCPEYLIQRIYDITGNLPEWLKHSQQPKYEVNKYWRWDHEPFEAIQEISEGSIGEIYITIAVSCPYTSPVFWSARNLWSKMTNDYLHVGICIPLSDYKYKVIEPQICATFDDQHMLIKHGPALFTFLKALYEHTGIESRGIVLPDYVAEHALYQGKAHPRSVLFRHRISHLFDWLHAVMGEEGSDYWERRCGSWVSMLRRALKRVSE